MSKKLFMLALTLVVSGSMALASAKSWTGVVSDSNCGVKHSTASAEAAACVAKCVAGGAKYALVSHGKVYSVEPQDKFADFAGKKVTVTGTMKGTAITATSVTAAATKKKGAM